MRKNNFLFFCVLFFSLGFLLPTFPLDPQNQRIMPEDSILLTDSLSREVAIPQKVNRIISLQPEITRILIALGGENLLVGLDYFIHQHGHLFPLLSSRLGKLPLVSLSGEMVNTELVLRLNPDIIFASPSEAQIPQAIQTKTGIPVVALSSMGRFKGLLSEIQLIGQILHKGERAAQLVRLFQATITGLQHKISRLDSLPRPRVYLSFWSSLTRTPVTYEPVNAAGGANLAEGLLPERLGTPGTVISVEKILQWDPDIILIHGNYPPQERKVTVEQVLADSRLKSVKAVKERQVYYTFGFWYWWDPAQVLTETLYLAKIFHPRLFSLLEVEAEGNKIFDEFYGIEKGFTALCQRLKCDEWLNDR